MFWHLAVCHPPLSRRSFPETLPWLQPGCEAQNWTLNSIHSLGPVMLQQSHQLSTLSLSKQNLRSEKDLFCICTWSIDISIDKNNLTAALFMKIQAFMGIKFPNLNESTKKEHWWLLVPWITPWATLRFQFIIWAKMLMKEDELLTARVGCRQWCRELGDDVTTECWCFIYDKILFGIGCPFLVTTRPSLSMKRRISCC